jgi:hypothetical protein
MQLDFGSILNFLRAKRALFMLIMLRDTPYNAHFRVKKDDIGPENNYSGNVKL